MDKILIICYVAADFGPYCGEVFKITPSMLGVFVEAPAWIQKTLMFKWLVNDGSLKVAEKHISKKDGENDPLKGVSAEGKAEEVSEAREQEVIEELNAPAEPEVEEKPKATRKKSKAKAVDAE